jgi:ubiquitin-like modifier-activating enzyme ATG7
VASALAVELMVSLLHHPAGHHAPVDTLENPSMGTLASTAEDPTRPLGILPQQIRGFLSHYTNILPVTRAFNCCTGCSAVVVEQYRADGFEFVLRAANNEGGINYLEVTTTINKLAC